jgi:hypothetical protein
MTDRKPLHRASWAAMAALAAVACCAAPLAAEPVARTFRQAFPVVPGTLLRLANLAGEVDLVPGNGNQVVVEATVHAEAAGAGETQRILSTMQWVRAQDAKGRDEWALSYPVDRYHSFSYPQPRDRAESPFWSMFVHSSTSTTYRGERVRVYGSHGASSSAPILYADLRVAVPAAAALAMRNLVGRIQGGALQGDLTLQTGNGDIQLESFAGQLRLNSGSGDIELGVSRGETSIDTGSGGVSVRELVGNAGIDTGSGDIRIDKVAVGKLALHTGSGQITVRDGSGGALLAETGSGEVKILAVEFEDLTAGTASGDIEIASSLDHTRHLVARTGSGDVRVVASPAASFDLTADQGSGDLRVDFPDAVLRHRSHRDKIVGARRGDGRTTIHISTGSGDCVIEPRGKSSS